MALLNGSLLFVSWQGANRRDRCVTPVLPFMTILSYLTIGCQPRVINANPAALVPVMVGVFAFCLEVNL